jgi:ubiquitin C-terminal hydrolase
VEIVNVHVDFPDELQLSVGTEVSGRVAVRYRLKATIEHWGARLDEGHYVANIQVRQDWVMCDDERSKVVTSARVHKGIAYILFYEQVSHGPAAVVVDDPAVVVVDDDQDFLA